MVELELGDKEERRQGSYTYTLDMMGDVDEKKRDEIREVG